MSKSKILSPILIALIIMCGLVVYLYAPNSEQEQQKKSITTPVRVYSVEQQKFPVTIEALGTANANESITITAQKSAIVQSIQFDDGDLVEKGQLLLKLNDREEQARLNELEINLQEAKRQLKRIDNLAQLSVASKQLLDEQQAKVKALKAQLEVAKTQLDELVLSAPFNGMLGVRKVSVGALVEPGDLIVTLDDMSLIKVDFTVAESHLPSVQNGQLVVATSVAYPGEEFTGKISNIASRVDPITRAIQIRAIVDNKNFKLRPGMLLQLNLQKQILDTLVIPESALVPIEDKQFVYIIENDIAVQKQVQVGLRKPGMAQIVSGLTEHDQVVVEGALRLRDGSNVNILASTTSNTAKG
ncbi:efflux RND transporter periplasmic adaptor subunit [Paraglaciecola aquimarina]|uniref:Efflux RND transporter periplasmic adaptor subunit n=1 Tax=Paraglaciecola algarum TaxID=3050085 RepID=A0ABS9D769_9ALTE|nr:efflux RND transporter periplasmic adaptor subunit [Paraglaciecola sp. G1-23]MCF2948625.1 efflux RND transporter periplasmic adaptor subunit [Paraglaciecola sp. G1-23]